MELFELIGHPRNVTNVVYGEGELPTNGDILRHLSCLKALEARSTPSSYWYNAAMTDFKKLYEDKGLTTVLKQHITRFRKFVLAK